MAVKGKGKASKAKASNVIEIDFDDYEPPRSEYFGEEPRRGVYRFAIQSVEKYQADNGNESIRWIFTCVDEPYNGWAGFMYTGLPGSENFFRTQHVVRALQGGQEKKLKLDLDNPEAFIKKAKVVIGRVIQEEYNNEMRAKLRTVAPDDGTVKSTSPVDDDEDGDEDFEDAEEFDDDEDEDEDTEADEEESDEEDEDFDEDEDEDDEDEDEDEDDEEEEEPEPEPAKKKAGKTKAKAAPPKATKKAKRK